MGRNSGPLAVVAADDALAVPNLDRLVELPLRSRQQVGRPAIGGPVVGMLADRHIGDVVPQVYEKAAILRHRRPRRGSIGSYLRKLPSESRVPELARGRAVPSQEPRGG